MSPSNSTRWCPTPEQLMILEEMYKAGVRTPNSSQIQKMTAHLSLYGRIEGKNVFYWFQNHKARERQKLRRKLMNKQHQELLLLHSQSQSHHLHHHHHPNSFLSFLKDGETQIKNNPAWRMDPPPPPPPKKWEMQNCMMRTFCSCDDWMMNMAGNTRNADHQEFSRMQMFKELPTFQESLPCCSSSSNNEPLKTLQLFPINSTSPNY